MSIADLKIHNLRNISQLDIYLHPRNTLFYGKNGSGKTSLIEAIYLLSNGHSFRTRDRSALIQNDQSLLTVFARTNKDETISLQKNREGSTKVKLNNLPCLRSSDLIRFLPCQLFHYDLFNIIDSGPSIRRQILDWGMFHVKHSYISVWNDYRRVLSQRNALLRQRAPVQQFIPWDNTLVTLAAQLDEFRETYVQQLIPAFEMFLKKLTDTPCTLEYYKGWDKKNSGKSLMEILGAQWGSDCQRQFTQSGPHNADLFLDAEGVQSKKKHSRGQQKIILIALKLAQAYLVGRPYLYLFDDLLAELDAIHFQRLMNCLRDVGGQFVFTAIDPSWFVEWFSDSEVRCFQLDNGKII